MTETTALTPGSRIKFASERNRYTVRAANERFAICTKPFRVYGPDAVVYTIIDFQQNIRGRENLIFCAGFCSDEQCSQALDRLASGETKVSHRHRAELDIESIAP